MNDKADLFQITAQLIKTASVTGMVNKLLIKTHDQIVKTYGFSQENRQDIMLISKFLEIAKTDLENAVEQIKKLEF